jgi:uncharacterized DUF497 family protein
MKRRRREAVCFGLAVDRLDCICIKYIISVRRPDPKERRDYEKGI